MGRLKGLKCRECGRYYPAAPVHVCEFCFGPLEVDYDYDAEGIFTETAGGVTVAATRKLIESGRIPRDESVVICITGNGLKTPDVLHGILSSDVTIRPSLSAFDRALAELKTKPE
jgi:threonine synthase